LSTSFGGLPFPNGKGMQVKREKNWLQAGPGAKPRQLPTSGGLSMDLPEEKDKKKTGEYNDDKRRKGQRRKKRYRTGKIPGIATSYIMEKTRNLPGHRTEILRSAKRCSLSISGGLKKGK